MSGEMMTCSPYAGGADLGNILRLRLSCAAAGTGIRAFTASEIRVFLRSDKRYDQADTRLWRDDRGHLSAFALMWDGPHLVFFTNPAEVEKLLAEILNWGVTRARDLRRESGAPIELTAHARDDDIALIELLESQGFTRDDWHTCQFVRRLDASLPRWQPPPGFGIRPLAGEAEVEAYVALYRQAMEGSRLTVESRLEKMRDSRYVRDLDLVAVAPDGTLAAFCSCHIDREENAATGRSDGWTDPIGTHPMYRRIGLMRALLSEAFRRLRAYGVAEAHLGTGSWNTPTRELCRSVGYVEEAPTLAYYLRID